VRCTSADAVPALLYAPRLRRLRFGPVPSRTTSRRPYPCAQRLERVLRDSISRSDAEWRMPTTFVSLYLRTARTRRLARARRVGGRGGRPLPPATSCSQGSQLTLLRAELTGARRHGRRVILVLAPLHPRVVALYGGAPMLTEYARTVSAAAPGVRVVDLTRLLTADEFSRRHTSDARGATKLTARVAAGSAICSREPQWFSRCSSSFLPS